MDADDQVTLGINLVGFYGVYVTQLCTAALISTGISSSMCDRSQNYQALHLSLHSLFRNYYGGGAATRHTKRATPYRLYLAFLRAGCTNLT